MSFQPSGRRLKIDSFFGPRGLQGEAFFVVGRKEGPRSRFQVFVEGSCSVLGASVFDFFGVSSIDFDSFFKFSEKVTKIRDSGSQEASGKGDFGFWRKK